MAKPIVSTTLGAEGIDAVPGRDIMIADEPRDFAAAVTALLADPGKAAEMGRAGRRLAEERYSWPAAGDALDRFIGELREGRKGRGNHEVGMHEGALAEVRR
jgi:glycosyltransferase involved in cell wall biosynthesis